MDDGIWESKYGLSDVISSDIKLFYYYSVTSDPCCSRFVACASALCSGRDRTLKEQEGTLQEQEGKQSTMGESTTPPPFEFDTRDTTVRPLSPASSVGCRLMSS